MYFSRAHNNIDCNMYCVPDTVLSTSIVMSGAHNIHEVDTGAVPFYSWETVAENG